MGYYDAYGDWQDDLYNDDDDEDVTDCGQDDENEKNDGECGCSVNAINQNINWIIR